MNLLDFIIKHPLYFDLILISIGLIAMIWCVLDFLKITHTDTPLERALKQLERERKENIKWQINRNLAARKRKDLIYDLVESCNFRDINIDYDSDRFYVIIKIHKDALIEREIKIER